MSYKNNFFDKNIHMMYNVNADLLYENNPSKKELFNRSCTSGVVNLEVLSHGVKSDLEMKKVGSDTRSYVEYHGDTVGISKSLKMK